MKATITYILVFSMTAFCVAADIPKRITKSSKKKPLDVKAEIKAFYLQLTISDDKTQKQVESLTAKAQGDYGGIYHAYEPQVIEWFPRESNWDAWQGSSDMTGRFLVIQPVGYGRSKHAGYDTALIAEFEAVSETTSTKLDPKHEDHEARFLSSKLTITFLGFRDPDLSPTAKSK